MKEHSREICYSSSSLPPLLVHDRKSSATILVPLLCNHLDGKPHLECLPFHLSLAQMGGKTPRLYWNTHCLLCPRRSYTFLKTFCLLFWEIMCLLCLGRCDTFLKGFLAIVIRREVILLSQSGGISVHGLRGPDKNEFISKLFRLLRVLVTTSKTDIVY